MTLQQFAENLIADSCKVTYLYDKNTLNNVYIEGFDASTRHSWHKYWLTNPQLDIFNILFQAESLLSTQKVVWERHSNQLLINYFGLTLLKKTVEQPEKRE